MASSAKTPGKVLCKYYMSNCCTKGLLCPFSHDWKAKPDMRCKYYMIGACVNGKNCRYDHVRPEGLVVEENSRSNVQVRNSVKLPLSRTIPISPINLPSISSSAGSSSLGHTLPPTQHKMVTLKEDPARNPKKWVQAAEFVPGKVFHGAAASMSIDSSLQGAAALNSKGSWFGAAGPGAIGSVGSYSSALGQGLDRFLDNISADEAASLLCPFAEMGHCPFEVCAYLHGDICDMCNRECLNPCDEEQRKRHRKECLQMHEREMERAFQAQESEGKQCAVCMEHVISKQVKSERRFGILQNCDHCFCLGCIRKWRSSDHTGNRTIRACPLCRTVSYFIIPSSVWIDDPGQKETLKQEYRENLGKKHCKYFNMGEGTCPFGDSCFYKHELADGTKVKQQVRIYENSEGERKVTKKTTLWDYLNTREEYAHIQPQIGENWDEEQEDAQGTSSHPAVATGSAQDGTSNNSNHDLFWLNYEPDIDDMDFL